MLSEFLLARIAEDEDVARARLAHDRTVGTASAARVLAECASKRRIVRLAYEATGYDMTVDLERLSSERTESGVAYVGDRILKALAAPYDDHPDYDTAWEL